MGTSNLQLNQTEVVDNPGTTTCDGHLKWAGGGGKQSNGTEPLAYETGHDFQADSARIELTGRIYTQCHGIA